MCATTSRTAHPSHPDGAFHSSSLRLSEDDERVGALGAQPFDTLLTHASSDDPLSGQNGHSANDRHAAVRARTP